MRNAVIAALLTPTLLSAVAYKDTKRISQASSVLREMSHASDRGVPQALGRKAHCVVIVPNLKKIAFIGGAKYGRGFASCYIESKSAWSAPAAIRIEGGSFGLQLGGSETDVILLVMNEAGIRKLEADKFTLGGEANAAAGPVGRNVSAQTDVLARAEILTYSRSRGVFAGLSLEGATLRPDSEENAKLYGHQVTNQELLSGQVTPVPETAGLLKQIQAFSGKGAPAMAKKGRKGRKNAASGMGTASQVAAPQVASNQPPVPVSAAPLAGDTSATPSADNTRRNTRDRAPSQTTADQGKNNMSDLEIERQIRRSVVADKSLSTYAHNVKIVATNGTVTLKGPVRSDDEKANIAAKAAAVVSSDHVTNQIEIAPKQ